MSLLIYIIFGALVGWVASMLVGTSSGLIVDIVVGIVGSVLGSWLAGQLGYGGVSGFNLPSFIVALIGAVILIVILRAIRR